MDGLGRNRLLVALALAAAGLLSVPAAVAALNRLPPPRPAILGRAAVPSGQNNPLPPRRPASLGRMAAGPSGKKYPLPPRRPASLVRTMPAPAPQYRLVPLPPARPATLPRLAATNQNRAVSLPQFAPLPQKHPRLFADRFPQVPMPKKRTRPLSGQAPDEPAVSEVSAYAQASVATRSLLFDTHIPFNPILHPASRSFAVGPNSSTSAADIAAVKQVIEFTRKNKDDEAQAAKISIKDQVARKLAEWIILRSDNTAPSFHRYAAFVNANPTWPYAALFTRRAENALWNDKIGNAEVLAFFANRKPTTAKGRFMLARALMAKGDRAGAAGLVRYAWRNEDFSAGVESDVLEMFGSMLTRQDHKVRMAKRFYHDDVEAGMREAHRLGGNEAAIANAWAAVIRRERKAKVLLAAVPESARHDAGYIFARVRWLRRENKLDEAASLLLTAPRAAAEEVDTNKWWIEQRILVRKLLDDRHYRTAYHVARDAPLPTHDNYRVDMHFTAGWIALRYLHDPRTAAAHFAKIPEGTTNPYALARFGYWQGRAADALGQHEQAKALYESASKYADTYYGQLARARLGLPDLGLRGRPEFTPHERATLNSLELVRAIKILYALDEREMLPSIYASLGEAGTDVAGLQMLGEIAAEHNDCRSMLLLGKEAYGRGLPLGYYAYPTFGLPLYKPVAPPIGRVVAYSIARQESAFNQKDVSSAHAMGLMQVTPEAGLDTAKRYKVHYDRGRLLSDPVYNMQMGAAELSNLFEGYRGSYILTFAGYNAGRGRVQEWIRAFGDPRKPNVDPVDWVERIPISETRNYVQRIMENMQVYRSRFGGGNKLLIEADMQRGAAN